MIKVYHSPLMRSVRVIWLLEELGLPYQVETVEFVRPVDGPFVQPVPFGRIPVIEDGELTLFESGAIVQYILERYGEGRLLPPPGVGERARFLQWLHFADATSTPALNHTLVLRHCAPAADWIEVILDNCQRRVHQHMTLLEDALADRDYLCGGELTGADVMMGYSILIARQLDLFTEGYPRVTAYLERLAARPAFRKAIADAGEGFFTVRPDLLDLARLPPKRHQIAPIPGPRATDGGVLKLYHSPLMRSTRIMWLLEELGLPYQVEVSRYFVPTEHPLPFAQVPPFGRYPAIEDGGLTLFESGAILEHLLERHGGGRLVPPAGSLDRARFLQWIHFAEDSATFPIIQLFVQLFVVDERENVKWLVQDSKVVVGRMLEFVDRALEGKAFLLGDEFSAADVPIGYTLTAARVLGLLTDRHPRATAYLARLAERPGYRKAFGEQPLSLDMLTSLIGSREGLFPTLRRD